MKRAPLGDAFLSEERRTWLLELLAARKAAYKTSSTYQLWKEGYHSQAIYSEDVMLQKINKVHLTPCGADGAYHPSTYAYSAAHKWQPGGTPLLGCDQWQ